MIAIHIALDRTLLDHTERERPSRPRAVALLLTLLFLQAAIGTKTAMAGEPVGSDAKDDGSILKKFEQSNVPAAFETQPKWQQPDRCGLNCLYALIRLVEPGITYESIQSRAGKPPPGGFTMSELVSIAGKVGVRVLMIKGDPNRLRDLEPPVILHLGDPSHSGHFICYVRRHGDNFIMADGTSGTQYVVGGEHHPLAVLTREASGYMLVPDRSGSHSNILGVSTLRVLAGILFSASIALLIIVRLRRTRVSSVSTGN
jgi:hypothetical protein